MLPQLTYLCNYHNKLIEKISACKNPGKIALVGAVSTKTNAAKISGVYKKIIIIVNKMLNNLQGD
jgi:hypothetical protein